MSQELSQSNVELKTKKNQTLILAMRKLPIKAYKKQENLLKALSASAIKSWHLQTFLEQQELTFRKSYTIKGLKQRQVKP